MGLLLLLLLLCAYKYIIIDNYTIAFYTIIILIIITSIHTIINELWAHIQRDHSQKWNRVVQTAIKQWNCEAKLLKMKGNLPRRPQNMLFVFICFMFFFYFPIFSYLFLFLSMFSYYIYMFSSFSQFWKVIESIILIMFCYV